MTRLFSLFSVAALAGLLLAACGTPASDVSPDVSPDASPETASPASAAESDTAPALAAIPAEPQIAPPPVFVPEPESLPGLDSESLRALFGEPSFIRRDPPAQLWYYQAATCVLDLFLYDDGTETYTVTWLDFREAAPSAADPSVVGRFTADKEQCLRQIILEMAARQGE